MVGGDTCEAIATAHNVNTTLLHENNPQIDPECSNIYIGEVLCVANSVIVPPAGDKPPPTPPPTVTPAVPSTPSVPVPTKTPEPQENSPNREGDDNDDDDADLPWCDEL